MRYYGRPFDIFEQWTKPAHTAFETLYRGFGGINGIFDIHPKSEGQFRFQQSLTGIPVFGPWYGDYMRNMSLQERNQNTRDMYGLDFSDSKYPWLAGLYSDNVSGSISSGMWQFSKNMSRLYK